MARTLAANLTIPFVPPLEVPFAAAGLEVALVADFAAGFGTALLCFCFTVAVCLADAAAAATFALPATAGADADLAGPGFALAEVLDFTLLADAVCLEAPAAGVLVVLEVGFEEAGVLGAGAAVLEVVVGADFDGAAEGLDPEGAGVAAAGLGAAGFADFVDVEEVEAAGVAGDFFSGFLSPLPGNII